MSIKHMLSDWFSAALQTSRKCGRYVLGSVMNTKKIPLSKEEKYSIYAAAVLFAIGYLLAAYICPAMLQRFGGLIICVGVLFSMKGLSEKLEALKEIGKEELQEPLAVLEEMSKQGIISSEVEAQQLEQFKASENRISQYILSAKRRLLLIEGSIVVFGTIINSWGDLIVYSINKTCT